MYADLTKDLRHPAEVLFTVSVATSARGHTCVVRSAIKLLKYRYIAFTLVETGA